MPPPPFQTFIFYHRKTDLPFKHGFKHTCSSFPESPCLLSLTLTKLFLLPFYRFHYQKGSGNFRIDDPPVCTIHDGRWQNLCWGSRQVKIKVYNYPIYVAKKNHVLKLLIHGPIMKIKLIRNCIILLNPFLFDFFSKVWHVDMLVKLARYFSHKLDITVHTSIGG